MKQRDAYKRYEQWCKDGHPELGTADTIMIAIGYVVNCTDGRPDYDEQALFRLLGKTFGKLTEGVEP